MAVLVVASRCDPAAQTIAKHLTNSRQFKPVPGEVDLLQCENVFLKHVELDGIYTDVIRTPVKVECVIFASRHKSESGDPTLTVHWTGNCTSRADFGGKPKTLSYTDPPRLRAALLALDKLRDEYKLNYAVTMEATHHGPTDLDVPTLFIEVGSSEREWNDPLATSAASKAIWSAATMPLSGTIAIGFGGGHYCNKQNAALRMNGYAFSHILPKYFFEEYDEQIVSMAFKRTLGQCNTAVLDWKGISGPKRKKLIDTLKEKGTDIIRV